MAAQSRYNPHGQVTAAKLGATLAALVVLASSAAGVNAGASAKAGTATAAPVVSITGGAVRGAVTAGTYYFKGMPYAAAPTGNLRWKPPAAPTAWSGIRDATEYGPSCAQPVSPFSPASAAEDCLFLNVTTPSVSVGSKLPVFVWIHGGGWTGGAGSEYDGTKLTKKGVVVVTVNYRLGALGYLAHPALESGGASGNYGQMDQQAALRWVQQNIKGFGGDPKNVTIAGESAGALSVIGHMISPGSQGLFQRAIIESGSFALNQIGLAQGEAFGQQFATAIGCANQTAACLRNASVADLVQQFPGAAIPGIVDGAVYKESFASALAAGRFARVPVINGINTDEQLIFVAIGTTVTYGQFVNLPDGPFSITPDTYESVIQTVMGVSASRAAEIAAHYPIAPYGDANVAFSFLDHDASWACPALQMNKWLAKRVPTFAYEFNDGNAPARFFPQLGVATHTNEISYILDQPTAPIQQPFSTESAALAEDMQEAWASLAATGDPGASSDLRWPSFGGNDQQRVISLQTPSSALTSDFAARHQCAFWSGN